MDATIEYNTRVLLGSIYWYYWFVIFVFVVLRFVVVVVVSAPGFVGFSLPCVGQANPWCPLHFISTG